MRATAVFAVLALVACAFAADTCVYQLPSQPVGMPCGPSLSCTADAYCAERTGVCTKRIEVGQSCQLETSGCVANAVCQGVQNNLRCIAFAGTGEECGYSTSQSAPLCHDSLSCNSGICTNGHIGDRCYRDDDCASEICTSDGANSVTKSCAPKPNGANCTLNVDSQCAHSSFCNSTFIFKGTCVPRIANGAKCNNDIPCMSGSTCVNNVCTALFSVADGGLCTNSYQCDPSGAMRCVNGRCSTMRTSMCASASSCSADQTCNCGAAQLAIGYGYCAPNKCYNSLMSYYDCMVEMCGDTSLSIYYYEGSCAQRNCANEMKNYAECSPASAVVASFLAVAVAMVSALWFGH